MVNYPWTQGAVGGHDLRAQTGDILLVEVVSHLLVYYKYIYII